MTFSPQINDQERVVKLLSNQGKIDSVRGMEKVRDRMVRARQENLEKKIKTVRGITA